MLLQCSHVVYGWLKLLLKCKGEKSNIILTWKESLTCFLALFFYREHLFPALKHSGGSFKAVVYLIFKAFGNEGQTNVLF